MIKIKKLLFIILLALIPTQAFAILSIDITKGNADPVPVAIPDFSGDSQSGQEIARVISNNLERSGLFRSIDKGAFIDASVPASVSPVFANWRQLDAQALVAGTVNVKGDKLEVQFRLWDVFSGQQIAGKVYNVDKDGWRRIAHIISDEIYKRMTGEEGYFDTRIVYIAETGPGKNRIKRVAIMDQDGENHKFLTDGRNLVLTPRFSPDVSKIIYLSYVNNKPRVYLRDLNTGRERVLGDFPGMTFAPKFSPDGKKALLSAAINGVSEIYEIDLVSTQKRKLTNSGSIATSPSYSPDTKQIVFNSDLGGSQQLYVMNSDGSNVRRISFGQGKYGTPVWSPRGDLIAYTKISGGSFYIGVMRPDGSGERTLAQGFLVEGPTWAPNGRVILFAKQLSNNPNRSGYSKIFSIDLTGYNERELVTPIDASDPDWSKTLSDKGSF